ncbi:MAG: phage tail tube protein [Bacteroidota bacterium]|jgi:predicted secreted protein
MAQVLSSNQPIEIDVAGGSSYKTLVCVQSKTVSGSVDVTEEDTDCGLLTAVGSVKYTITADAVCETAPTVSQVSYNALLTAFVNKTLVNVRVQNPVVTGSSLGVAYYHSFYARITQLDLTGEAAGYVKFSITLNSDGIVDITV